MKPHWLRSTKLPTRAIQEARVMKVTTAGMKWGKVDREVIVSAIDSQGAFVRRKGCMRYYAPLSELSPINNV